MSIVRLTVVESSKPSKVIEPVTCPVCGDRTGRAIETVVAPVRRKNSFKWLRKATKRELICLACDRNGITTVIAE